MDLVAEEEHLLLVFVAAHTAIQQTKNLSLKLKTLEIRHEGDHTNSMNNNSCARREYKV